MTKILIATIILILSNNIYSRSYTECFESKFYGPIITINEKSIYQSKLETEYEEKIYNFENIDTYTVIDKKNDIIATYPNKSIYDKYITEIGLKNNKITELISNDKKKEISIITLNNKILIDEIVYSLYENEWMNIEHFVSEFDLNGRIITSYFKENNQRVYQKLYYYDAVDRMFPKENIIIEEYIEDDIKYFYFHIKINEIVIQDENGLNVKVRKMFEYSSGFPESYEYKTNDEVLSNIVVDEYIFNTFGNVESHLRNNLLGNSLIEFKYSYVYDKYNNWTNKKITKNNDILVESDRFITYK